jgi:hypothetical protein
LYFKVTCENHFSNFPYQSIGEIRQNHAMFSTRRPPKIWVAGTLTSLRGPVFGEIGWSARKKYRSANCGARDALAKFYRCQLGPKMIQMLRT